jgi:hypothetical protein
MRSFLMGVYFFIFSTLASLPANAGERPEHLPLEIRGGIRCLAAFAMLGREGVPDSALNTRGLTGQYIGDHYVRLVAPWQGTMGFTLAWPQLGNEFGNLVRQGQLQSVVQIAQGCINHLVVFGNR